MLWRRSPTLGNPGGVWGPCYKMKASLLITSLFLLLVMTKINGSLALDCFKCVSVNGDNPSCEDPFHNNYSLGMLESPCMAGRKGREGLFPATACIKLAGIYDDNGQSLVIRDCTVDSGSITLDTELARMSHCGAFVLSDRYVKGCLQSCEDSEGCNGASLSSPGDPATVMASLLLLVMLSQNL